QISDDLVVSLATVKTHTHNIYKKLGVHSRQELYLFLGLENLS
ncbi:MAG: helix-turn-helix transcriptional regulator, partial [Eggerthellaceae bacterium]|nr:helix-turn-helix transcriptional regulator [Eggerthellaceae bacterium]